ncbi:hypothetical protein Forpi1262_v011121 [Fusarium oxysporum f. sp. raphani]|uniref:Uncharacterized protein n=1 Tax=Fusarium oxysporum f. sp. raphani TaxID=96318 RepID=A0A8J5PYD2_FUSOX|nr:hypothetical protein Forpi1262_v011121 [Fusarium oxysporum f. sp. raphani]
MEVQPFDQEAFDAAAKEESTDEIKGVGQTIHWSNCNRAFQKKCQGGVWLGMPKQGGWVKNSGCGISSVVFDGELSTFMTGDESLYGFTVGSFDGRFTVSALRNCNASYCCPSFLSKVAKVIVIMSDDLSILIVIQCLIRGPKADSLWLFCVAFT